MEFCIQPIATDEYARIQAAQGTRLIRNDGVYWQRVRPLFYRPLLPFQELPSLVVQRPTHWPAAFQYATGVPARANSHLSFLTARDLQRYSLSAISHNRRRLIKAAARRFTVRQITVADDLKAQGHGVYLSFYERTAYSFRADRTQKAVFDAWVDTLFCGPEVFVLGAYDAGNLVAVSVSFLLARTLVYATLFAESEALRQGVGEVMLHTLRLAAAQTPGIARIIIRAYQGGDSRDQYYLQRGCELVRQPARLEINPLLGWLLARFAPEKYARLRGLPTLEPPPQQCPGESGIGQPPSAPAAIPAAPPFSRSDGRGSAH